MIFHFQQRTKICHANAWQIFVRYFKIEIKFMLFNLNFYQKLKKNWGDHYFQQNNLNLISKSSNLSSLIMFPKQKFFLMKSFQLPKGIQHRLCTFCDFWRQDWWDMKQKRLRSNAGTCRFFSSKALSCPKV